MHYPRQRPVRLLGRHLEPAPRFIPYQDACGDCGITGQVGGPVAPGQPLLGMDSDGVIRCLACVQRQMAQVR